MPKDRCRPRGARGAGSASVALRASRAFAACASCPCTRSLLSHRPRWPLLPRWVPRPSNASPPCGSRSGVTTSLPTIGRLSRATPPRSPTRAFPPNTLRAAMQGGRTWRTEEPSLPS
eukprot:11219363-Alexandrium_andersonii.AAC.1